MSKTHELRKKALEAVRDRDWNKAIQIYERICSADSGNGSPRNELGDIHLKTGDVENAIVQFQEAARLYQEFGLTNNAVAVHKKILRHDPNHLHSLWVLGEIRLAQGLDAEASAAFLDFLARADAVADSDRDAFVARGLQLLDKMADDPEILSRLDTIFNAWDRGQERAQVLVAKARLAHEADEYEVRDKYIEHARAAFEHLDALPDFVSFRREIDGGPASGTGEIEVDVDAGSDPDSGTIFLESGDDAMGLDLDPDFQLSGPADPAGVPEISIDLGFDFDAEALSGAVERVSGGVDPLANAEGVAETPQPQEPADVPAESGTTATVDLLAEILSDETFDAKGAEERQIASIEQDVRGQIAAQMDEGDHAGQYELGLVYMDMGLFEQAAETFALAARGTDERLRAIEMQGTCLLRLGRTHDAMDAFQAGIAVPGYPSQAYLGLLYGVGMCHEAEGNVADALDYLARVAAVDGEFLDVGDRLNRLRSADRIG